MDSYILTGGVWTNLATGTTIPAGTPITPRFPGDPGLGNIYNGMSTASTTLQQAINDIGQPIGCWREYFQDNQVNALVAEAADAHAHNALPLLSTKVPGGNWAAVASGAQDVWLRSIRDGLKALSKPTWLCFHHEPRGNGTGADYKAMYAHLYPIMKASGGDAKITIMPILNGQDFDRRNGQDPNDFYPGAANCDIVGTDHYNQWWTYDKTITTNLDGAHDSYHPFKTVQQVYDPIINQCQTWGKQMAMCEWGVHFQWNDPSTAQQYVKDTFDYLKSHSCVAMSYFNSDANSPRGSWELKKYTVIPPTNSVYVTDTSRHAAFQTNLAKSGNAFLT